MLQSTGGTRNQNQNGIIIYVKGEATPQLTLLALGTTIVTETGMHYVHKEGAAVSLLEFAPRVIIIVD